MPHSPSLPFDRMSEADVREEVIAPLLRDLGYRTGTQFDVIREQSLRYPRVFLGRKDPRKDPELRGKADYILEVNGRTRWVVEAKAPGVEITVDDIEQAWTYANHAEVRAVYFVLCNGREFRIYSTQSAPSVGALLSISYEELEERFSTLSNVLAPAAIERDFPEQQTAVGHPIGPGLRSIARVSSGLIRYQKSSWNHPVLGQLQVAIVDGAVERDENNHLIAFLRTQAPLRSFQEFNERMGFHEFEMVSQASELSIDPARPTEFVYSNTLVLPEGEELLDMTTWNRVRLSVTVRCDVSATALGVLDHNVFAGRFTSLLQMRALVPTPVKLEGEFFVRV